MRDPIDPDTEDRRPDHERDSDDDASRQLFEEDDFFEDNVASSRQLGLFDDEEDLVELSLDDLRDMEGPDA